MGHPARIFVPGLSLHVMRRGVNRCAIVADADDFATLIRAIRFASTAFDVSVHGFTIMDNHYHALVTPSAEGAVSGMMKALGETYVKYFNRKYDRIGTLWTGRFQAPLIEDERRWLTCLRYIELNPVTAKIVERPDAYEWSSYRVHACGEPNDWLVPHPLYLGLGRTPEERQAAYRALCAERSD